MIPDKSSNLWQWADFYSKEWAAAVIPLREGKLPLVPWLEFQMRPPTRQELGRWFIDGRPWGMALVCGTVSADLIRLDFDDPADYAQMLMDGAWPKDAPTFRSQRAGGGYGVMLRSVTLIPKLPEGTFEKYPKLGVNGQGSITVVPPTPGYEWINQYEKVPLVNVLELLVKHCGYKPVGDAKYTAGGRADDELNRLLRDTEEGGRSNAIVRIVNILRSRGLGLEAIKTVMREHIEGWSYEREPLAWEDAEGQIERNYRQYEHEGTRFGRGGPAALEREFEDVELDMAEPPPPQEGPKPYLVDGLVMAGDMANVAMAAYAGMGKTTITLGIALCMAQGRPVWGALDVPRPLKVVFIDQEEVRSQIQETVNMMAEVYGRPRRGMLTLLSGKGDSYSVGNPGSLERLEQRLDRILPDFVFLDGWQWFVDNKISDRDVVGPALAWWKRIRSKYGCGTWFVHHTRKAGAPQFRPADPIELASGAQTLMDQARTKLIYEHLTGDYLDYGFLQGRCGRAEWNPIRIVLEYDQTTQSHRLIGRAEGEGLFDAEVAKAIWGEGAEVRRFKGLLNRLNRLGLNDAGIAEFLGVGRSMISQCRAGTKRLNDERLAALESLAAEKARISTSTGELQGEGTQVGEAIAKRRRGGQPVNRSHAELEPGEESGKQMVNILPAEHASMPVPDRKAEKFLHINIENNKAPGEHPSHRNSTSVQSTNAITAPDKDSMPCAKCPLRGRPFVGGRGGGVGCTMLVGEGPGTDDAKSGRAYSGLNGKRLEKLLERAKIDPEACRFTHIVQCHVPKSRAPTKRMALSCRSFIEAELARFRPKMVITLGETAFAAFYPGKLKGYHGTKIDGEGYTLVPMYKPDAFDHAPDLLGVMHDDFAGLSRRPKIRQLEGEYCIDVDYSLATDRASLDVETTGLDLRSEVVGMAVSEAPGEAYYFHGKHALAWLDGREFGAVVMQNAKFDLGVLESSGIPMSSFGNVDDTMLLAYCMERRNLGLKDLVLQELNLEMGRFEDLAKDGETLVGVPAGEVAAYCGADADGTLRLWERLWGSANARERKLYLDVEKPLVSILAQMELRGIDVDVEYLGRLGVEVDAEMDSVAEKLKLKFGLQRDALTSPKKMQDFIYRKLGLSISALTDPDNPSTGRRILERIRHEHEAVDLILRFRELSTMKNSFVVGIINRARDGRLYPSIKQAFVVTGRMSTENPNFQGIPSRRTSEFRKAIVAPEGYKVVAFDNSQIDIRALAYISKCPVLNAVFERDGDIHAETSMAIYGDVEGTHRFEAKAANFMPVFGGTYIGLARRTGLSEEAAQKFLDRWYEHYYGVAAWIKDLKAQALSDGYVDTIYGRRRHIPGLYTNKRSHALRQAQNMPIQGTSADVLKLQMIAVPKVLLPFAQIHDELDFYIRNGELAETIGEIKLAMEGVDCPFKLKVDVGVGPSLGELKKWEEAAG